MKITPENITELKENEIFVFGSNLAGRHGKGAALLAKQKFGARYGQGVGLQGKSWAIPTKDNRLYVLSLVKINKYVKELLEFANYCIHKEFLVTEIGCGLAGYSPKDIAPLFLVNDMPANVSLPKRFLDYQNC